LKFIVVGSYTQERTKGEQDHKMTKKLQLLAHKKRTKGQQHHKMTNKGSWPCSPKEIIIELQQSKWNLGFKN
jgi:hypothetical protein